MPSGAWLNLTIVSEILLEADRSERFTLLFSISSPPDVLVLMSPSGDLAGLRRCQTATAKFYRSSLLLLFLQKFRCSNFFCIRAQGKPVFPPYVGINGAGVSSVTGGFMEVWQLSLVEPWCLYPSLALLHLFQSPEKKSKQEIN